MIRRRSARSHTRRLAALLSTVGNPFVLLPLTVFLVSMRTVSPASALAFAVALASLGIVPLVLLITHKVRTERGGAGRSRRARGLAPRLLLNLGAKLAP